MSGLSTETMSRSRNEAGMYVLYITNGIIQNIVTLIVQAEKSNLYAPMHCL